MPDENLAVLLQTGKESHTGSDTGNTLVGSFHLTCHTVSFRLSAPKAQTSRDCYTIHSTAGAKPESGPLALQKQKRHKVIKNERNKPDPIPIRSYTHTQTKNLVSTLQDTSAVFKNCYWVLSLWRHLTVRATDYRTAREHPNLWGLKKQKCIAAVLVYTYHLLSFIHWCKVHHNQYSASIFIEILALKIPQIKRVP